MKNTILAIDRGDSANSDTEERWLPIFGYEGYYDVSDRGRVRSLARFVPHSIKGTQFVRERILRPGSNAGGYLGVNLQMVGRRPWQAMIHRVVAQAFVSGEAPGLEVAHLDGDQLNNCSTNLEWKSHPENEADKLLHGTHRSQVMHCTWGHEFTDENTYVAPRGTRECRRCRASRRSPE